MYESCLNKQKSIVDLFRNCTSDDDKYQKIIELGKLQARLDASLKTEKTRVAGCQSNMYIHSWIDPKSGLVFFETESDALISAGLGMLLVKVYSGQAPETILKCPPQYIDELHIHQALTPGRSNGLASLFLRMKQEALQYYMKKN